MKHAFNIVKPVRASELRIGVILLAMLAPLLMSGCGGDEQEQSAQAQAAPAQSSDTGHDGHAEESSAAGDDNHDGETSPGGHEPSSAQHDGGAQDVVELSASQLARLDIRIESVGVGAATSLVNAPATVVFNRDRIARIGPRLDAKVVEVVADLGDEVQTGDPLMVLDSVALGQAKARHLTTKARVETMQANYQREQALNEKQITSDAELLEARARLAEATAEHDAADEELRLYGLTPDEIDAVRPDAAEPLSRYVLESPLSGVVEQRDAVPGQSVAASETPMLVVDTSTMWLMIDARETDLARLGSGQPVEFSVRSFPARTFTGTVDFVAAGLDEQARTVRVRAQVDNADGLLRDGMFATAQIATDREAEWPVVPVDAVQQLDEREIVFVPGDHDGEFRAVEVTTGAENSEVIEIVSGLDPGQRVVAQGAFDLTSALTASTRSASHSH